MCIYRNEPVNVSQQTWRLYEFQITATDCCLMATHLQQNRDTLSQQIPLQMRYTKWTFQ